MAAPRVLVIGLDAMEPSIAWRLAAEGGMPNVAGLLERGRHGLVRNADALVVGSVWPSFATGTSPGTHGLYCFRQFVNGEYRIRRFDPYDIQAEPFWDVLSREGLRCGVFDVPLSRPSVVLTGAQVVEWGSHDKMLDTAAVGDEAMRLVAAHGGHPISPRCDDYARRGDWSGLLTDLRAGASAKAELACDLMAADSFDVFTVVFGESHCAGHQFWAMHDDADARHDPALVEALGGDPLTAVYEACDAALGRVLETADDETTVMVVLSHGIGSHHDGDHLVGEVLERLGDALRPRPVTRRVLEWSRRAARRGAGAVSRVDGTTVDASRAFWKVPNNELFAGIRFNLAGREPRGVVQPGRDLRELIDELTAALHELVDPVDGRPLVTRVLETDEHYPGPNRDALPDLLVDWDRSKPITAIHSPMVGTFHGTYDGVRSGDHRPSGLLVSAGPHVAQGRMDPVQMVDLAPTIAATVGVGLPEADGRPIDDLLPPKTEASGRRKS